MDDDERGSGPIAPDGIRHQTPPDVPTDPPLGVDRARRVVDGESDPGLTDDDATERQAGRADRVSVLLTARIERFGSVHASRHRVRNLSVGGVRIDQAAALRVGATVLVSVGDLESVGATVVWVRDGDAGLCFAEPIDIDRARTRVAIAPVASGRRPR